MFFYKNKNKKCPFLQKTKKPIHKHQFGFQKGKSTEHAILDIYVSILTGLEKKQKVCCIFLDFAFDTVNHEILLTKFEYYVVRGIAHELMKSYLFERLQCVKIRQSLILKELLVEFHKRVYQDLFCF